MKAKIVRTKAGRFIEIPDEMLSEMKEGEYEIFPLRDGFFILIPSSAFPKKEEKIGEFAREEFLVLKKLNSFRFDQRVPEEVNKALSAEEKRILAKLLEKKFVTVFRSRKYPSGVYNISDGIYPKFKKALEIEKAEKKQKKAETKEKGGREQSERKNEIEELEKSGYAVIESEFEAKRLGELLSEKIKRGEILGVRGFDKKFYVATKKFYEANEELIFKALSKEPKTSEEIATAAKLDPNAARVLLVLMSDSGEVIEKRKGMYAGA